MDMVFGLVGGKVKRHVLIDGYLLTDDIHAIERPFEFHQWIQLLERYDDVVGVSGHGERSRSLFQLVDAQIKVIILSLRTKQPDLISLLVLAEVKDKVHLMGGLIGTCLGALGGFCGRSSNPFLSLVGGFHGFDGELMRVGHQAEAVFKNTWHLGLSHSSQQPQRKHAK